MLQEELIRCNLPGEGSCIVSCQQVMKQGCQLTGGPKHFQWEGGGNQFQDAIALIEAVKR